MIARTHEKITTRHRQLHAYIYVRQSTPKQVQQNQESQRNQYALVQRALDLGWPPERIQVIDARDYNDRLLLGLRGILSEAELHVLRLRMDAGRQRQIERGTYRQHLPTGLVRLEDGRVVKDPDLQVQRSIELVFARFTSLGSCQKVLRSLRDDGILLPRRQHGGLHAGEVLWRKPTAAALIEILHNPAYAGAFVYGRRP